MEDVHGKLKHSSPRSVLRCFRLACLSTLATLIVIFVQLLKLHFPLRDDQAVAVSSVLPINGYRFADSGKSYTVDFNLERKITRGIETTH